MRWQERREQHAMGGLHGSVWGVAVCALVSGCATLGRPDTQTLQVQTPGWPGASCELANDRGTWRVASTPASVSVETSAQPLRVACRAEGGGSGGVGMPSTVNQPTSGAGAVAGGALGGAAIAAAVGATALSFIPALGVITVGLGVATGAVAGNSVEASRRVLRYPDPIVVTMTVGMAAEADAAQGPRLGMTVRSLAVVEARERGIGERAAVLITAVAAGSRAHRAGLLADDVVLGADAADIASAAELEERVRGLTAGAPLQLRIWRAGRAFDVVVAPAPLP